jgi:hypothetical protein
MQPFGFASGIHDLCASRLGRETLQRALDSPPRRQGRRGRGRRELFVNDLGLL